MIKKRTIVKVFVCAAAVLVSLTSLYANSWSWTRPYKAPSKYVSTLLIVPNSEIPKCIADLIQVENKQPILLLPTNTDGKIYFLPAAQDKSLSMEFDDMSDFIRFLKPEKIIVIGKHLIPEKFLDAIDPTQTVITVSNKNWRKVTKTLTRILNLTYLNRRYADIEAKIKSGELYRPENSGLGEEQPVVQNSGDMTPVVVLDESNDSKSDINANSNKDKNKIIESNIVSEPKLIDETKVVPQK